MFSGSMVAIVTPMTADGNLDWPAWDRLLDFHLHEGTQGIVVAGTTGESPALGVDEVEELTRRALARCRGRLTVIVGAGTHSTADTVARTRLLSRSGVDAVMLVTPYYNKPTQEGLFRHFTAAADASAAPIILYNVPSRTAVDMQPATVARLARHPRIVAVKEAVGSVARARIAQRLSARIRRAVGRRCHCGRVHGRGGQGRDLGHCQRRARANARGLRCGVARRCQRRPRHRCGFAALAPGLVHRGQSHPGEVGSC